MSPPTPIRSSPAPARLSKGDRETGRQGDRETGEEDRRPILLRFTLSSLVSALSVALRTNYVTLFAHRLWSYLCLVKARMDNGKGDHRCPSVRYDAPGPTRTGDLRLRRPARYPTELRAHIFNSA